MTAFSKKGINENAASTALSVGFIGDISFNGKYIDLYRQSLDPFENLRFWLFSKKHVIGNLECMPKGEKGQNYLKKPRIITTEETLNFLININVTVACLAHNHIYDHLEEGFGKTLTVLDKINIRHLGAGFTAEEATNPLIISENGISLGLLNYVTLDTNPNLPQNAGVYTNIFDQQTALADISRLKGTVDHIVVMLHWGGRVEGGLFPDFDQPQVARNLIDAGADLIIGHHSHTIQPIEKYKGKYIFYSIGNFCFSDFIFEDKLIPLPLRRRITAIVGVDFRKNNYSVNTQYFRNDGNSFKPLPSYKQKINIRNFIQKNLMKYPRFWKLYYLHKQYVLPLALFMLREDVSTATKIKRLINAFIKRVK